jgi:protein-S-isoprenylcysteine O-methyltransferase Ste14
MKLSYKRVLLGIGATAFSIAGMGAILFLIAGRWDLPWFWAYLAVYGAFALSAWLFLDAGLLKERLRPGPKARDKLTVSLTKVIALAHYAVAALDVGRFGWSGDLPVVIQGGALLLVALSGGVAVWTMAINPFFSTVVRIQEERGHHVITDGAYRIVRHPGYAVITVMLIASGPAFGSWWSMIPGAVLLLLLVRRTRLEDGFLHQHLEGYTEYALRVRYRLIPGVW